MLISKQKHISIFKNPRLIVWDIFINKAVLENIFGISLFLKDEHGRSSNETKPTIESALYNLLNLETGLREGKTVPESGWVDFSYFEKIEIPKDQKSDYDIPDKLKNIVKYV